MGVGYDPIVNRLLYLLNVCTAFEPVLLQYMIKHAYQYHIGGAAIRHNFHTVEHADVL